MVVSLTNWICFDGVGGYDRRELFAVEDSEPGLEVLVCDRLVSAQIGRAALVAQRKLEQEPPFRVGRRRGRLLAADHIVRLGLMLNHPTICKG